VSVLAFALAFASFAVLQADGLPGRKGWAFGLGYFLLTLQWLVSPFLVDPEQDAWMAPFAIFFMAGGLALFWALAFRLAWRLRRASALVLALPLAELARAYVFTGFAWGMPAYGLVDSGGAVAATWIGSHGLNVLFLATAWG
jgi:apolipoprotein N-acyltransferase